MGKSNWMIGVVLLCAAGAYAASVQPPRIDFIRSKTMAADGITTVVPGHLFEIVGSGFSNQKRAVTVEILHVQSQQGPGGVPLEPKVSVVARIEPTAATSKLLKVKLPVHLSSGMREARVVVKGSGASGRLQFRVGERIR